MGLETDTREGRGPDHRLVCLCLVVSLVFHLGASWLSPAAGGDRKPPERAANPALKISLGMPALPESVPVTGEPEAKPDSLQEITLSPQRRIRPAATVIDATGTPRLNLSVPRLPEERQQVTRGTVVSEQLNRQLAQFGRGDEPRGQAQAYTALDAGQSSFESGGWTSRVRLGDKCFRVVAADPLQPGSFEQWFAIKCDS